MIEFHRLILADKLRNDAFASALRKVITPGETTVVDIGSGTGYLAFVASKLGAKECHLYEHSDMLKLSKKIAKLSGITNCKFHHEHSAAVKKPPKADVVVSETLGNYALEENILETLRDAKRFLKPGGIMIPQKLTQYVAPVIGDRIHSELDVWELGHGLDYAPAREACFNNIYVRTLEPDELLAAPPKTWDRIDFREENESDRQANITWDLPQGAKIYGFALWWDCELLPGISIGTAPNAPKTHWEQIYLPVPHPLDIEEKGAVSLTLHSDTRYAVKVRIRWAVETKNAAGKVVQEYAMDMWRG